MIELPTPSLPEQYTAVLSRWERWRNDLLAGRGWVSLLPILLMGMLLVVGSSKDFFHEYTDVSRYRCYAFSFWQGGTYAADPSCSFLTAWADAAPFHTLPLEYPLLALLPFSLTLLAPLVWFQVGFAIWMALFAAGIYWYLGRVGPRGASLAFAAYLVLGAWATAAGRFDLVPAAFTLFCLVAAVRGRFVWAYVLLAFAVMFKLYPLPLLLPLFLAEQRASPEPLLHWRRLAGLGAFVATCLSIFVVSLLVDVQGALSPLGYFAYRPIQIESVPASVMWALSLFGWPVCTAYEFGSLNIYDQALGSCSANAGPPPGPLTNMLSMAFLGLLLVGLALVAWMQWRGKLALPQAFVLVLLVIILTGKVFSPQYFIWLAPLVAYVMGLDGVWFVCWCVISLLTTVIYPFLYGPPGAIRQAPAGPAFFPTIALRNLLLALVVLAYLCDVGHVRRRIERVAARPVIPSKSPSATGKGAATKGLRQ
jgi:hypothetical protein